MPIIAEVSFGKTQGRRAEVSDFWLLFRKTQGRRCGVFRLLGLFPENARPESGGFRLLTFFPENSRRCGVFRLLATFPENARTAEQSFPTFGHFSGKREGGEQAGEGRSVSESCHPRLGGGPALLAGVSRSLRPSAECEADYCRGLFW